MAATTLDSATTAGAPVKRRFVGRSPSNLQSSSMGGLKASTSQPINQIPLDILDDPLLSAAIEALLPKNYSFEVHKTIWHVRKHGITRVALQVSEHIACVSNLCLTLAPQMPEGLAMFATSLTDLIERFTDAE